MIFRRFPYTTLNDINLDWIIKQVKQIAAALQGKQDKPDAAGTAGQVLGLDENLDPVWLDQSGGGGTNNYNDLANKPQINSVTISGNKTAADLGLAAASDIPVVPVQSVNGQTGAVELDAGDVGALPSNTFIPGYSLQLPVMDGEASAGTNFSRYAMEGHRHPTDTSRASAAALETYGRPNLLDNWYFVGGGTGAYGVFPVNQRAQASYSNANAYTIDRWKLTSGSLTVTSAGITLNGTIVQILPASIGVPVVASALLSDETMISPTYNDSTKTFTLTATGQTIAAVKLEVGDTQTLAHENNGLYVLNELPVFGDELVKCKRYFYRWRTLNPYTWVLSGVMNSATQMRGMMPIPNMVALTFPTITFSGSFSVIVEGDNTPFAVSAFSAQSANAEQLVLMITCAAINNFGFLKPAVFRVENDPNAYIDISFET